MAKTGKCKACGNLVSKKAKSCPHCRERKPYKKNMLAEGTIIRWFIPIIIVFVLFSAISGNSEPTPEQLAKKLCRDDFRDCQSEEDLIDNYLSEAGFRCERVVKEIVRYGKPEFPNFSFHKYSLPVNEAEKGTIALFESNIGIPNMFGAIEKTGAICQYSFDKKRVTKFYIEQNGKITEIKINNNVDDLLGGSEEAHDNPIRILSQIHQLGFLKTETRAFNSINQKELGTVTIPKGSEITITGYSTDEKWLKIQYAPNNQKPLYIPKESAYIFTDEGKEGDKGIKNNLGSPISADDFLNSRQ